MQRKYTTLKTKSQVFINNLLTNRIKRISRIVLEKHYKLLRTESSKALTDWQCSVNDYLALYYFFSTFALTKLCYRKSLLCQNMVPTRLCSIET